MSKYIDLAGRIAERLDVPCGNIRLGIHEALAYLDRYPDQVPGRTITESDFHETADAHRNGGLGWEDLAIRFGITVIPDPEPTNAERLDKDIQEVDLHMTSRQLAEALIERGWTKAPEEQSNE